jgi:hypothetical protein
MEADNNILKTVIQGMAQMQYARYIGRRNHNGKKALTAFLSGFEAAGIPPEGLDPVLKGLGIVGFFQFNSFHH